MIRIFRRMAAALAIGCALAAGASSSVFAAAGAPPSGPLEAPKDGAELKHACGQTLEGFGGIEGERFLREALITQCRATVAAIIEMVKGGEYAFGGKPVWQCLEDKSDQEALAATFVTWVGRRPQLLRKPAAIAFVEAIEMSAKCP